MYLNTLASEPDPTSADAQSAVKDQVTRWVENSEDVRGDLDHAFQLWTAVSRKSTTSPLSLLRLSLGFCRHRNVKVGAGWS